MDFFNLIGTPVHELGHLCFAVLFGYKIDQVCLFRTMKKAKKDGTLGFVKMHHEGRTFLSRLFRDIGQFFIGIGPLVFGPCVIYGVSRLLPDHLLALPSALRTDMNSFAKALHQLNGTDIIVALVFLYIIIGISLNMELSRQDMELAYKGIFLLELFFLVLSFLAVTFHWNLDYGIQLFFRWNLMISCIGIISSLIANLISLI
jgi:hypothetical protein